MLNKTSSFKFLFNIVLKPLQILYCLYALANFIFIMGCLLPLIFVAALFGIKGGNFIYKIGQIWSRAWYFFVGIYHKEIYENKHDTSQQYIFVANHVSYIDIPPIVLSIHQPVRALGKYEMVKIPVFGWIYKVMVILVNRNSAENRAKSVRALKAALAKGLSIVLFPEGTFNVSPKPLKEFYDGAFKIAIETRTNIQPILLPDTIDRLHWKSIFSLTPGKNRVVYLKPIKVDNYNIKEVQILKQKVYAAMEEGLRKYRHYND
jgi:1-acyl-sn-glycerol-3-phosphate acyltransferase